ncbi:MAG: aldehyde ferredoxin oxidoreductase family protein [Chloroflexota bacterium]
MSLAANGYAGRVLRVNLTTGQLAVEEMDKDTRRKWIGGSGYGAKVLYEEVPPGVAWDDAENRLILASGPLAGTSVMGSGTFSAVTKGPMTNGATTTQANGFLGAYMKFAGFDAVILQGKAERWQYLYLHDGQAELRDATHLLGQDTWQMQDSITVELGKNERALSVFGVGPAGEHLVRYAAICGDHGHVAGHNGSGAVMGAKRLKAVVAERGDQRVPVHDQTALRQAADAIIESVTTDPSSKALYDWGTSLSYVSAAVNGWLPVKNMTTNVFPENESFTGPNYRPRYELKRAPCFACRTRHLHMLKINDGPYAGFVGEEPEYEQMAAWGSQVGITDVDAAVVISNEVDRLGFETNELAWVVGWAIECREKGLLTTADTDGLALTWGDVAAIRELNRRIAFREGPFANLLAEGVKFAAERTGRGTLDLAIYTGRNTSPRTHDHRGRWIELLDTIVSNTGTMEIGQPTYPLETGAPARPDPYSPEDTAQLAGKTNGRMLFEDCLGTCRFTTRALLAKVVAALNAATGFDYDVDEAMRAGRRIASLLRAFNLRHGLPVTDDYASPRYVSAPVDGPVAGKGIAPHLPGMLATFYDLMGWDLASGRPYPETLRSLGLDGIVADLWPKV